MWRSSCRAWSARWKAGAKNPFRKVLLKFGHKMTAFKVQMIAKLQAEAARELTLLSPGRVASVHKPMRPVGAKR